jgi:hypothetical protein
MELTPRSRDFYTRNHLDSTELTYILKSSNEITIHAPDVVGTRHVHDRTGPSTMYFPRIQNVRRLTKPMLTELQHHQWKATIIVSSHCGMALFDRSAIANITKSEPIEISPELLVDRYENLYHKVVLDKEYYVKVFDTRGGDYSYKRSCMVGSYSYGNNNLLSVHTMEQIFNFKFARVFLQNGQRSILCSQLVKWVWNLIHIDFTKEFTLQLLSSFFFFKRKKAVAASSNSSSFFKQQLKAAAQHFFSF